MLLRHLGFIHGPIREHCPVFPNCMDVLIEKYNASTARRFVLSSVFLLSVVLSANLTLNEAQH